MNITAKQIELTPTIRDYVEKKINQAFEGSRYDLIQCDVVVERTTRHHKNGDVYRVSANVEIANSWIFSEETHEDLYAAIDFCADEVRRQVFDLKGKQESKRRKVRRTARRLKSLFSLGDGVEKL